jgi:hypothetical protein
LRNNVLVKSFQGSATRGGFFVPDFFIWVGLLGALGFEQDLIVMGDLEGLFYRWGFADLG